MRKAAIWTVGLVLAPWLCLGGAVLEPGFAVVQGRVLDAVTRLPLPGARLSMALLGGEAQALSDGQGCYRLDLLSGKQTLDCSLTGTRGLRQALDLKAGQVLVLDLLLDSTPTFAAQPYVVQGRRLGLPEATQKKLNAPLVRELTKTEKKMAPIIHTASDIFMWTIWALIALSAAGMVVLH